VNDVTAAPFEIAIRSVRTDDFPMLQQIETEAGSAAIRHGEGEHGLDRWPRVCMRRELEP
jgi:hypothetical protein